VYARNFAFCEDQDTLREAEKLQVRCLLNPKKSLFSTPFVNYIFNKANELALHKVLCYLNADIIVMDDFVEAIDKILKKENQFLAVGRRWDVEIKEKIDFSDGWQRKLLKSLKTLGRLHSHTGIDFLVFPKGLIKELPPFLIGRPGWDSWLIYHIRSRQIPIINITKLTKVVHQNHDYCHHPKGSFGVWHGEEAQYNFSLTAGPHQFYTLEDASHCLTKKGTVVAYRTPYRIYRKLVDLSVTSSFFRLVLKITRKLHGLTRRTL